MVGSGLSLNAEPLPGVTKRFPTWRDLVRSMFDELYPATGGEAPEQVQGREDRFNHLNPLTVASEYEATFGRRKLDVLISENVPDSEYLPGRLHQLLMQLPWADVFTTNYDTLLERAEVNGRTYQPVTKASELTTAFAPRIVKLHGSFPSQTPFIISEEDYRTYPQKFAPLVNSVRQSLLENSFVLIGFSGDDPNFLEWTGWIRDELGGNHAPIYLVGPLSLGSAGRSLLEMRGVTPIDLSPLFADVSSRDRVHAMSIEWFLASLSAARPPRKEDWPKLSRAPVSVSPGLPPLIGANLIAREADLTPPPTLTAETVSKLVELWRVERERYPGWIVLPEGKRSGLWLRTKAWIWPLANFSKTLQINERIFLFREINWRLEAIMAPIFSEFIEPFGSAVDEIYPFLADDHAAALPPTRPPSSSDTSRSVIADAWVEIAFGLLRVARENYDTDRWGELKAKIDAVVRRYPQHSDRNHYETALLAIWNVDRASTKTVLAKWQPSPRSPIASMRKAALLAELDELSEARTLLRSALAEIRRALRTQGQNIELLSLEGWCAYLLSLVEPSLDLAKFGAVQDEFAERWHELNAWYCDPRPYLRCFEDALSANPPQAQVPREQVRGFDPGQVSVTIRFSTGDPTPYLPSFAFIRVLEQVGIPVRLPWFNTTGRILGNACRWIAPFVGFWSPALLIRAGKVKDITEGGFLTRSQVASMNPALAKRIYAWCLQIFERELASLVGFILLHSALESLLEVSSEVLSRLALWADGDQLRRTFSRVLFFHRQPGVRSHIRLHKACDPWFQRLFEAADVELLIEWLPELITAPFPDEAAPQPVPERSSSPDPMRHFPCERIPKRNDITPENTVRINEATDWLLKRAASETGEARRRAIDRLINLCGTPFMSDDQRQQLGGLLWSRTTTTGLPDWLEYGASTLLGLPAPPSVDVTAVVKNYILALPPQTRVHGDPSRTVIRVARLEEASILDVAFASKPILKLIGEPFGAIEWTLEEATRLYSRARDWWAGSKAAFQIQKESPFPFDTGLVETARRLGQFLARAALPYAQWSDDGVWMELTSWLRELRGVDVFLSEALPYFLIHRPSEMESVSDTIAQDIDCDNDDRVAAGAKAIRHWIHLGAMARTPQPPPGLLTTLIERVIFRRKPGICACLGHLACLIVERPDAISPSQATLLGASLLPWHNSTRLPAIVDSASEFHEEERPGVRMQIAHLAGALRVWYVKMSPTATEPPSVQKWRDLCASDPLPEIRRAFDVWAHFAE